jgi:hypothetical protein
MVHCCVAGISHDGPHDTRRFLHGILISDADKKRGAS